MRIAASSTEDLARAEEFVRLRIPLQQEQEVGMGKKDLLGNGNEQSGFEVSCIRQNLRLRALLSRPGGGVERGVSASSSMPANVPIRRSGLHWRHWAIGLLIAWLLFPQIAVARTIAGVHLPDSLEVDGQALPLKSCGVRDTLWVEHYVAAIYVPPDVPAAPAMQDPNQTMAILLHITSTAMLPEDVPEKWREPLRKELAAEPLAKVREAYSSLSVGDRVQIAYLPKSGVTISVNGTIVTKAAGRGLIESMLHTWAGSDPIAGKLERVLLDHPC